MNYQILVNKENVLDKNCVPDNLVEYTEYNGGKIDPNHKTLVETETLNAFLEMQNDARLTGYNIVVESGYRSYEYQAEILKENLIEMGEEVYKYVALPGTSEHQTGLAIDVALYKDGEYIDKFDDSFPEIKWLHENCYKYGFILRYPKGKEDITGYNYKCWHFRYVGKELASEMKEKAISTLEEYYLLSDRKYI